MNEKRPLFSRDISDSTFNVIPRTDLSSRVRSEIVHLLKLSFPVVIANLTIYLILTESIIMAGHLSKYELDAVSLSNSILNVFGLAVATGLSTACDTLFSQMYTSPYRKSIGMMLQKSVLVLLVFPICLIAFYLNAEPLFVLMGQDPVVSRLAGKYILLFSPGIIFVFLYIIFTRYLQNQTKVLPPMIVGVIVNIFNAVSQYIAIYQLNLGYETSAIFQAISFVIFVVLIVIYIRVTRFYEDTWDGWTKEAFIDWWSFLKLAIPGAGMVLFECFSFEISTILSGILGTAQLAAQTVVFQMETITFNINFAVGVAVNIRVGNELGAGNAIGAKLAYRTGLIIIVGIYIILASLELGLMYHIPAWFTNDKEAQLLASDTFPIIIGIQFFDCLGTMTMGALRGCGRQKLCVAIVFLAYYLMGLPIGIYLAFYGGFSLKGLWIGLLISLAIVVPTIIVFTNFIQDWDQQAKICQARIAAVSLKDRQVKSYMDSNVDIFNDNDTKMNKTSTTSDTDSEDGLHLGHKRSFTESFSSSASGKLVVKLTEMSNINFTRAIIQKCLIYAASIFLLIVGVLIHLLLPKELYTNHVNSSVLVP